MGERALKELKQTRSSLALEVIHQTPYEGQWTCIADGVQAATGVSVGKMNLEIEATTLENGSTTVRDKDEGKILSFRLKPSFVKRYIDLPHDKLSAAGREAIALPDDAIFTIFVMQR
jgi:formylmethanofuran dehydrogenase subunit E